MIYVYCRRGSDGARALSNALQGQRLRKFDGMDFWRKGKRFKLNDDSTIICWGARLPDIEGVNILNNENENGFDKYRELKHLAACAVPVPQATLDRPKAGYEVGWMPRLKHHIGGNDLLNPNQFLPDYWVKMVNLKHEYRLHSFNGKSIRAGKKVPRAGFELAPSVEAWNENQALPAAQRKQLAHPKIRSYDAGWKVDYNGFGSTKSLRQLAHKAVKSLGLTFGAVDIGEMEMGGFIVLEVNRAPGVEGGTIEAYARAIKRWLENQEAEPEGGEA